MKSFKRSSRVADQIQRDVSDIVSAMLRDKVDAMVTISAVNVSDDLRHAKIYYTVLGGEKKLDEIKDVFDRSTGYVQRELAHRLRIRRIPEISFKYDTSLIEGIRLTTKIDQVIEKDIIGGNKQEIHDPETISQIIDTLNNSEKVLIVGHINPDGDSIGSQLGFAGYLDQKNIKCRIINEGTIPFNYEFLPGIDQIENIENLNGGDDSFDTVVFIECSTGDRCGKVASLIDPENQKIINIDHHRDNSSFGHINFVDNEASAAGEMIYDILLYASAEIDSNIATNLYTAIVTDTGQFQYSCTTSRSLRIAAVLMDKGIDYIEIINELYHNYTPGAMRLLGTSLLNQEYHLDGKVCYMTVTDDLLEQTGSAKKDTEGLINYSISLAGVVIGVLFREISANVTKASFRSANGIDIIKVAAKYGGGGHRIACGCTLETSLDEAKKMILADIKELLNGTI
ncbi:MAG: 30S ribosome-binding factor RbfA [candidate division Zixibacteria bacterium]